MNGPPVVFVHFNHGYLVRPRLLTLKMKTYPVVVVSHNIQSPATTYKHRSPHSVRVRVSRVLGVRRHGQTPLNMYIILNTSYKLFRYS